MIVALIAIAPFIAAVFAPWIKTFAGPWLLDTGHRPRGHFATFLSFIGPIADFSVIRVGLDWIPAYGISFSFFIDGLSLVFGVLISGIGTFIVIYSGGYRPGHPHQGRFFLSS